MSKIYRLHPNIILGSISCIILSSVIMFFFGKLDLIAGISLGIMLIIILSVLGIYKIILNEEGIVVGTRFYFDFRKSIKWDEIASIDYKPILFLKAVRITPLGDKWSRFVATIGLSPIVKHYPQLLQDIIMHTYDVTKIAPEVLKLAGITQEELGNRRSTTLVRIIE